MAKQVSTCWLLRRYSSLCCAVRSHSALNLCMLLAAHDAQGDARKGALVILAKDLVSLSVPG
eukprot:32039-Eustigmatos_ZCMA.PRE.1